MIVPYAAGGGSDQMARLVAQVMEKELGVQMPVINTPGATGSVGTTSMLSRPPGSAIASTTQGVLATLAFGTASFEFESVKAICRTQVMPSGLLVAGDGPYQSWQDLAKAAKANPGKLTIATVGRKSADSIVLAQLKQQGIDFRQVPFSESGERYTALLSGEVDALYEQPGDLLSQLKSGQMKTVLVFGKEPVSGLKKTQGEDYALSGREAGLQVTPINQFRGLLTNAETSAGKVRKLSDACAATKADKKWQDFQSRNFAAADSYMTAKQFNKYLHKQYDVLQRLIKKYHLGA